VFSSWRDFYQSDLQSVYALWFVPALFLLYRLARPAPPGPGAEPLRSPFVERYGLVFALETMLDPLATGLLVRWLGLQDPAATYCILPFVLLGDFRVFVLIFAILEPRADLRSLLLRSARWTLIVPIAAWTITQCLRSALGDLPGQTIWIVYELAFFAMAVFLERRLIDPSATGEGRSFLRALARYVALYYALWATADLSVVLGGFDWGWALRVIPNQLYYSLWVPFAYFSFFARK
jgi:hypothetical protein